MNSGRPYRRQVSYSAVSSALVYSVPPSVGWEMYTIPGWTMCSVDSSFLCHST